MQTIPAQEIKRRGLSALDKSLKDGPVHVIKNNKPQYVVLTEAQYHELLLAEDEAYLARIKSSLLEVRNGKIQTFQNVADLLQAIEAVDD